MMLQKRIELFLLFISTTVVIAMQLDWMSIYAGVTVQFYLLVALIVNNWTEHRKFTLYQVWIVAFIYMILSEMLIKIVDEPEVNRFLDAMSYLLLANNAVLLGYALCTYKISNPTNNVVFVDRNQQLFPIFSVIFYIVYFYYRIDTVLKTMQEGRQLDEVLGSGSLTGYLMSGLEIALPILIGYHLKYVSKKSNWLNFLVVLPIFILQLLQGTRYVLLFSLISYMAIVDIINFKRAVSIKKNVMLLGGFVLLIGLSAFVKEFRNDSLADIMAMEQEVIVHEKDGVPTKLARKFSPEGIVRMIEMADDYFATHPHSYGKEVSFLLYFWVPRSWWPDKPTPVSHWLIRKYEFVSDESSTSSGFCGELQADFGIFSLFFLFIIGLLLKIADLFVYKTFTLDAVSPKIIVAATIIPYVFFSVRSPINATTTLIAEWVICGMYIIIFHERQTCQ